MLFLEADIDHPLGSRKSRWWAAHYAGGGGPTVNLPLVMADSGHQVSTGPVAYYSVYKAMVDAQLQRPPQVAIRATARREGNRVRATARITNLTGAPLSSQAILTLLVYEEAHIGLAERYVRAVAEIPISPPIPPSGTADLQLATTDIAGVNWDKIRSVVLVDWPGPTGAWDMAQAAMPLPVDFAVRPNPIALMVDPQDGPSRSIPLTLLGDPQVTWEAASDSAWLTVDPEQGTMASPLTLQVSGLSAGWKTGVITFTATNAEAQVIEEPVPVRAYYGPVYRGYLPLTERH